MAPRRVRPQPTMKLGTMHPTTSDRQAAKPAGTWHRRHTLGAFTAFALMPSAWLTGCSAFADLARVHVSLAELVAMIERQFPREQRVLEVIDVVLRQPKLKLLPQSNRLATDLSIAAKERIFGRGAQGRMGFEYALRFEPADYSVRLADVRVGSIELDGGQSLSNQWQGIAQALTQRLLEDLTVVKLSSQRADALRQLSLNAAAMTVTERGLDIRFSQAGR